MNLRTLILGPDTSDMEFDIFAASILFNMIGHKLADDDEVDVGVGPVIDGVMSVFVKCTKHNYEQKIKEWWNEVEEYN